MSRRDFQPKFDRTPKPSRHPSMSPQANIEMGKIYAVRFERFLAYLKREAEAVAAKAAQAKAQLDALEADPQAELVAQLRYERRRRLAEVAYEQQRRKAVEREKDVLLARLERTNQQLEDAELLNDALQQLWGEAMKSFRAFAATSSDEHGRRLVELLDTTDSKLTDRRANHEARSLESEAALVARLIQGETAFVEELRRLEHADTEALLAQKGDGLEPPRPEKRAGASDPSAEKRTTVRSLKDLDKLDLG